jgi:hypothetical protein
MIRKMPALGVDPEANADFPKQIVLKQKIQSGMEKSFRSGPHRAAEK